MPWPGGSVGWSLIPHTKRLQVRSPVRAHASVVGSVPGWGASERQLMDVSLTKISLSPHPRHHPSLSQGKKKKINKHILR